MNQSRVRVAVPNNAGSGDRESRPGYDVHGLTIRRLLNAGSYTGHAADRMRAVGAMSIDGRIVADEPYYMRTPAIYEIRLARKHLELMTVAGALYDIGQRDVALEKRERPDFVATLIDGRRIGIEHTEVNPSARNENSLIELNNALKGAVRAEPRLIPDGSLLAFSFGHWVRELPGSSDVNALVEEIVSMLRRGGWKSFRRSTDGRTLRPPRAGSLVDRYGVIVRRGSLDIGERVVQFHGAVYAFDPEGLYGPALARLADKVEIAQTYPIRPLWLVLALTDGIGLHHASVRAVARARPAIAPFERIIVTDTVVTEVME